MIERSETRGHSLCPSRSMTSLAISFLLCTSTVCGFLIACERIAHWFLVPVLLCGVLIGIDAVAWFRGRLDIFDPAGVIGLLGVQFFFLSPPLHVPLDLLMLYVNPPPDRR